ncbi:Cd(II)/Pb(II)-responsive transcriptional regulator [Marinobacter zhanjiangensis]|uniref:MerR family transcriptional regulator n=1 Tax=Marinobacter zhanjiangensis TaxID=578215 RepID=A0ABQ3B895_9GAMM|nr:Cd(II)/Pb(II)-responsive transcriptional regulator [Marinobacter zhanjiangensis]GGY78395.1 MerR family transcriptional regulator [Marinobacter zhanjiangensis]
MRIGQVAEKAGTPVETVRYYEKIGLLPPPDRELNGYRDYRQSHLDRLMFIRRCRNLDMAQDEIRELVRLADRPGADCSEVDSLLARHLEHVRERLEELRQLESTLSRLQQACSEGRTVAECGILGGLSDDLTGDLPHGSHNHIPGSHGSR